MLLWIPSRYVQPQHVVLAQRLIPFFTRSRMHVYLGALIYSAGEGCRNQPREASTYSNVLRAQHRSRATVPRAH